MDPKERDKGVNPGDSHYNDDFFSGGRKSDSANELDNLENQTTIDANEVDQNQDDNLSSVRHQEQSGQWQNNVTNTAADKLEKMGGAKGKLAAKALRQSNNASGPAAILGIVAGLLIVVSMLIGSALPMQIGELFTADLSDASAATQVRSERLLARKIGADMNVNTTCQTMNIRCKYNTLSDRQIDKYRAAGFEVETSSKSFTGRNQIDRISLTIDDGIGPDGQPRTRTLSASNSKEFMELRRGNPEFRKATTRIYNPRTHIFVSSAFGKVFNRFNLAKNTKFSDTDTKENRQKKLNKQVGASEEAGLRNNRGELINEEATRKPHDFNEAVNGEARNNANTGESRGQSALNENSIPLGEGETTDTKTKKLIDSGAIDAVCAIYDASRAISAGIKSAKIAKLMQYAMVLLPEIHKVKAGKDPEGKSLQFVGETLSSGLANRENVSNSASVQAALTGSSPGIDNGSEEYNLSSGGIIEFTQSISDTVMGATTFAGTVLSFLDANHLLGGGDERTTGLMSLRGLCLTLSIFDGPGNLLLMFTGVGLGAVLANIAIEFMINEVFKFALPKIIESASEMDLSANTTDANAANALFAGAGHIMSRQAASYGMKPSSAEDIREYISFRNEVTTHNIAMDIEDAKSEPFNINNQYSFIGMLSRKVAMSTSNHSSLISRLAHSATLLPKSLSSLLMPSASAAYTQPHAKFEESRFKDSNEPSIAEIGATPDIFGNVRYSLSPRERNYDAEEVLDWMIDNKYVDEEDGKPLDTPQGKRYQHFLDYCVDRQEPLGESSKGLGSVWEGDVVINSLDSLKSNITEVLSKLFWETGEACIDGQKITANEEERIDAVAQVDESFLIDESLRDSYVLTGKQSHRLASNSTLISTNSDPSQVEIEMFRVFTMDMALNDDIDGEIYEVSGGSESSEGGAPGPVSADGWVWPSTDDSIVTSGFGIRNGSPHQGLDVAHNGGSDGKPIFAAQAGEVIAAGPASGFGNWIIIKHNVEGEHIDTVYGHMWNHGLSVSVGDTVEAGQEIGKIGNAGESYGAHLHFEIWPGGRLSGGSPIDPATVLQPPGGS